MPLTSKGKAIKKAMDKEYGSEKGEKVFYASKNKGNITGVEKKVGDGHHVHSLSRSKALKKRC